MVTSDGEKTCDTGRRSSFPPFWLVELRTNDAVNRHVGPRCDVFSSSIFFSSEISNVDMSPHLPLSLSLSFYWVFSCYLPSFGSHIYRVASLGVAGSLLTNLICKWDANRWTAVRDRNKCERQIQMIDNLKKEKIEKGRWDRPTSFTLFAYETSSLGLTSLRLNDPSTLFFLPSFTGFF